MPRHASAPASNLCFMLLPRAGALTVTWQQADVNETDDGELLVSQCVWDKLEKALEWAGVAGKEGEASARRRIVVAVSSASSAPGRRRRNGDAVEKETLTSMLCWARRVNRTHEPAQQSLAIPCSLLQSYPNVFYSHLLPPSTPHQKVLLIPTRLIPLSTIFLAALSSSAHVLSRVQPDLVLSCLSSDSQIIRQGARLSFVIPSIDQSGNGVTNGHHSVPDSNAHSAFVYAYRVLMCEPVLQGTLDASKTRLYVVPPPNPPSESESEEEDDTPTQPTVRRARTPSSDSSRHGFSETDAMEDDALEIDSSFLAHSLPPLPSASQTNSISSEACSGSSRTSSAEFMPVSLPRISDNRQLEASNESWVDEESCIYVRTSELAKVGVFSGDWAVVSPVAGRPSQLARVFSGEEYVPDATPPYLFATPTFLHPLTQLSHPLRPCPNLTIAPTPFLSHPPPLPTAHTVTLARIASPASTTKTFQPLFERALRQYFERGRRLVRMGGIIGVGVSAKDTAFVRESEEGESIEEFLDYEFLFSNHVPDTPIFFRITNITYDAPLQTASSFFSESTLNDDAYSAATLGELGCWFDPTRTRMVQAGVEHARVPDLELLHFRSRPAFSSDPLSPFSKLRELSAACLSPSALEHGLQLCVLLHGSRGIGKCTAVREVARQLGMHVLEVNCYEVVAESDVKTEATLRARFENAASCSPCIFVLRHLEALARTSQALEKGKEPVVVTVLRDCIGDLEEQWRTTSYPVIVIATSAQSDKIPLSVLACFKHDINFEAPGEAERLDILQALLEDENIAPDVSLVDVAAQSAALVAKDLVDLISRARMAALDRAIGDSELFGMSALDLRDAGIAITAADFAISLAGARASYSDSIGAPKIPNVSWDDVGGLADIKADILDTIQLPLQHPELFAKGLKKRSGILLYGPPGTGKTLLAKAVATSCSLNFFSVKGPELLNMYIGESEANVRRVFQRARDARPCVIFFDELDSVAPKRGNHGDSGGVMDRIVSQLLAELDGMSDGTSTSDVFVIGATNRPDLLDPALLRPGRFDRMLYLGVSTTHEAQLKILEALTRKFRLDPYLDLFEVAELCPFNYTGADFYALCSDAMLKAMARKAEEIDAKIVLLNLTSSDDGHPHPMTPQYYLSELATADDTDVLVSQIDFEAALAELVPSVTQGEMEHYAAVQRHFSKDTINSEARLDRKGKGKGRVNESA